MKAFRKIYFLEAVLFLLFGFVLLQKMPHTFAEDQVIRTGVFEWEGARQPVHLFVPSQYKTNRSYPLLISFPEDGESGQAHIQRWSSFAESHHVLVMVPDVELKAGETPYFFDQWLLEFKKQLMLLYRVSRNKVFLTGSGKNAHYAAYLGIQYPGEFSAVAMNQGGWSGPLEKLLRFKKSQDQQIPFIVAVKAEDAEGVHQIETQAQSLQGKGYLVHVEKIEAGQDFFSQDFEKNTFDWLVQKSEAWQESLKTRQKSWKEKFWNILESNVKIE